MHKRREMCTAMLVDLSIKSAISAASSNVAHIATRGGKSQTGLKHASDNLHHWVHAFFLSGLVDQTLVDVWDNTSSGNGSLDQSVQLFVTTNSQL